MVVSGPDSNSGFCYELVKLPNLEHVEFFGATISKYQHAKGVLKFLENHKDTLKSVNVSSYGEMDWILKSLNVFAKIGLNLQEFQMNTDSIAHDAKSKASPKIESGLTFYVKRLQLSI